MKGLLTGFVIVSIPKECVTIPMDAVSKLALLAYHMLCHCERSEVSEAISLIKTAFREIATHASGMLAMTES